jgi:hypothetical protein
MTDLLVLVGLSSCVSGLFYFISRIELQLTHIISSVRILDGVGLDEEVRTHNIVVLLTATDRAVEKVLFHKLWEPIRNRATIVHLIWEIWIELMGI